MTETCEAVGCDRDQDRKRLGFCIGHYRRYARALTAFYVANGRQASASTERRLLEGVKDSGPLRRRKTEPTECMVKGCDRMAEKHDRCGRCYMRAVRSGEIVIGAKA